MPIRPEPGPFYRWRIRSWLLVTANMARGLAQRSRHSRRRRTADRAREPRPRSPTASWSGRCRPEQLGELRGKVGWLASAAAKQERVGAQRAAGALPGSLERIGEAEGRAERSYRAGVEAQRAADATGIPRLSAAAEAAIGVLRTSPDEKARAGVWRAVQKDERVAGFWGCRGATVRGRRLTCHVAGRGTAGYRYSPLHQARAAARVGPRGRTDGHPESRRAGCGQPCLVSE